MEMWLKRTILMVFLAGAAAAAALERSAQAPLTVIVDENQNRAEAAPGSSLTFHCRLNIETQNRFRVNWQFRGPSSNNSLKVLDDKVVNKSAKTSTVVTNKTKQESRDEGTLSIYTLSNATEDDSGWYYCKVTIEIPSLRVKTSNGTEVVITKSIHHTTSPSLPIVTGKQGRIPIINHWFWIILGVSAFILIALLLTCVCLRRRRSRSRGEDPIYANTHNKQPSPRPGMDNLKAIPMSQNLRNPSPCRNYDDRRWRQKQSRRKETS
ncbi:uncharacterized protein LOC121941180 isoform X2 [Plectropomus leopardus]|uniref:uncharacterized protein LOC121941180 isoform X2 n=1 Tax=Plectropomus leopardus TaxID=160734 RepID=UPI001C4B54FF|nr:uncharacterized protein LOC121941180 isoform X2 [Plectropomus leopardus]